MKKKMAIAFGMAITAMTPVKASELKLIAGGIELGGPFPGDLQRELVFPAAVAAGTTEAGAAKQLIDFLKTRAAAAAIKAVGMTPG
jgi:molybdate transport system substrate-binding protein